MVGEQETDDLWFKVKSYVHIGRPLRQKDLPVIKELVRSPDSVARYAFLPLVHRKHLTPKYSIVNEKRRRKWKIRHLFYASHVDAQIYAYYSQILSKKYEDWLKENDLDNEIIAYRRIKKNRSNSNKCHIDFANEVFREINELRKSSNVGVIVSDISKFFDNLDHKILKRQWCRTLGMNCLPPDHFNVFKATTRFSYIDEEDLFKLFQDRILTKRTPKSKVRRTKVKRLEYLRDKHAIAFCERKDLAKIRNANIVKICGIDK